MDISKATVNTNMFLEAFKGPLKLIYLHHKQNRRVDYLLTTLLKVARDKAFERFRKLEKGKRTHRIFEINKRHKAAEKMAIIFTNTSITPVSETEWEVPSQRFSYNTQLKRF